MLHHEESPEKPCYNVATPPSLDNFLPPFCLTPPPLSSKIFRPPNFYQFWKSQLPLIEGEGGSNYADFNYFIQK